MLTIICAGRGKMAAALRDYCKVKGIPCILYAEGSIESTFNPDAENVAIHFGKGRELRPLLSFCEENGMPLIQGSTNMDDSIFVDVAVPVIDAPNLSLSIVAFLATLPSIAETFKKLSDLEITLAESHQDTKPDIPSGTAQLIARIFGISLSSITVIRNKLIASLLGVPKEHLDGHGYHWLNIKSEGVDVELSIKANGRDTYAHGAIAIAKLVCVSKEELLPGVHTVTDLMTNEDIAW